MPMNISGNTAPTGLWYGEYKAMRAKEDEDYLCLRSAIENWQEQMLSGGTALTDEEKEKIREMIKAWLEENPLETEEDKAAFTAFVKQLYKMFGARHDLMYFIEETMIAKRMDANPSESKESFLNFTSLVKSALDKVNTHLRNITTNNRTFVNFGGNEIDPVPTRLFPLQMQLKAEHYEE